MKHLLRFLAVSSLALLWLAALPIIALGRFMDDSIQLAKAEWEETK